MKKYYYIYMAISFGILAFFGVHSAVSVPETYSESENRYLEKYPSISLPKIVSGEFQEKFELAFSDQFIERDNWIKLSTCVEKMLGYQEISDVYLGKEHYYFARNTQEMIDQKQYSKNLHYVEHLGTLAAGKTSLMLVPSPATVLSDKLPEHAPYYDAADMYRMADILLESTGNINIRSELATAKKEGQVYFKTDHHWTLRGAYAGYCAFCKSAQLEAKDYAYFKPKKVTKDFYGTMYSRVLDANAVPDVMYAAQNIPQAEVESDGKKGQGVYDVQKLKQKDKYAYFFGGNYGEMRIRTGKNQKNLLLFKDSFANSFLPFLLEDYGEITVIDLRYYRNSVQKLLQEKSYDQILVLYEMSNFAQEKNLYKLIY